MASFINNGEKLELQSVFDDLHDTFKRVIKVFIDNDNEVVGIDLNADSMYGDHKTRTSRPEFKEVLMEARILYINIPKMEDIGDARIGAQLKIDFPQGAVRLKLAKSDYDILKKARRLEVDGEAYTLRSDPAKRGPFFTNYYTLYLVRSN